MKIKWIPWWENKTYNKKTGISITNWIKVYDQTDVIRYFIICCMCPNCKKGLALIFKQKSDASSLKGMKGYDDVIKFVDYSDKDIIKELLKRKNQYIKSGVFLFKSDKLVKDSPLTIQDGLKVTGVEYKKI